MEKTKIQKIGNVVFSILLYIFLAISIFAVFLTAFSKKDIDGAAEIFGYQMRIVTSNSMAECEHTDVSGFDIQDIPVRSLIFVEIMPEDPAAADEWYRGLKVGDVLTFRYVYTKQVTITHRIVSISEKETGGFVIELAGDNKNADDGQLTQIIDTSIPNNTNYVIGKVTGQSRLIGAIMTFLLQPASIVLLIIVPCVIIIIFEVVKIVRVFSEEKRLKEKDDAEKKDKELDELRRKLAELEELKSMIVAQKDGDQKEEV